ncbi:hypothetical protein PSA01_47790 [Pseudonocardia saturnea]|uniref:Uncharacterized protein n=1 Tax=Pseudonocardia saturnea TaxID=33909 RepID=A0ABQ0S4A3_9PSEU|nr:hypothetical protein Pdca_52060 [Pseudonocardia autotrophica]GEC27750.1 hypothetical protein PSA01_47790 [Pseudonocardia saturnea]
MSRKAPAAVRREQIRDHPTWSKTLPRVLATDLERIGRADLRPEQIAGALAEWRRMARRSRRELSNASDDDVQHSGPLARDVLDTAVRVLPRRSSRTLRALVRSPDEAIAAKTLPDPFADPARPWWHRRLTDLYHGRPLTRRERERAYRQAGLGSPAS